MKESNVIEGIDYIICPICKNKIKKLTTSHLKRHSIAFSIFKKQFPNQQLVCKNTSKLIGDLQLGKNNHQYGKPSWNKGLTKAIDRRVAKYSESISKTQNGKTYEERFGIENSKKHRNNISKAMMNRYVSGVTRAKIGKANSGKIRTEEHKCNMRIAQNRSEIKLKKRLAICKNIKKNGGLFAGYNSNACEIFKQFDELNNTNGIFATNPYEFQILGYSLDYINFDKKLIIEIDEKHHFDKNGLLKSKDVIRQREIQELYSGFKFLRFREENMSKILEMKVENFKGGGICE